MKLEKKIQTETIYAFSYKFIGILISFFSVPILINYLGKDSYGLWITISSVLSWFLLFDFGLGLGLRNKLTEVLSAKDYETSKKLIASAYISITIIFLVILGILLIIINHINWNEIFNTFLFKNQQLTQLLRITVFGFCLIFIFQIISNLLYAVHDSSKVQLIKTLRQLVVFIPIALLIKSEDSFVDIYKVATIGSLAPLLVLILFNTLFFKKYKRITPRLTDFNFNITKSILYLGAKFFVLRLSSIVLVTSLPFLITRYIGVNETANYNIGFKFFGIIQMGLAIILMPYWAAVAEKYSSKDFIWIKKGLKKTIQLSILGVLAIVILCLLSTYIIPIWIGNSVLINYQTIYWAALLVSVFIITEPLIIFLSGTSKVEIQTYYSIAIIILVIPISLWLFYKTKLGLGAFIITPVAFRLIRSLHAFFQLKRILSVKE